MNEAVDAITATDIAAEILTLLSHHAVGLVKAGEGEGSQVLGSGVLVTIEGRRGILTCGHVAEVYDKLTEVGLVRFSTDGPQRRKLKAAEMQTVMLDSGPEWTEMGCDLAFTILLPDVAASIEAQGVFLNLEMNRPKLEASVAPDGKCVDAILGLVHELSGEPFVEGSQCISPMQGMFHTGYVTAQETGILTFETMDQKLDELPKSFEGMSGGGLWRIYFVEDEKGITITGKMLLGVASWQTEDRKIRCQGWDRIDQGLIPAVQKRFPL